MNIFTSSPHWWRGLVLAFFFVVFLQAKTPAYTPWDFLTEEFITTYYDYGDAPSSYGDAYHTEYAGLRIGDGLDVELGSQSNNDADGDDDDGYDDEDGVVFLGMSGNCIGAPGTIQQVEVTVLQSVLNDAFLAAWIDFNGDGDFDSDERIITNQAIYNSNSNQVFTFSYTIPAGAVSGTTYARFRLMNDYVTGPTGWACEGEVEDYKVSICSNGTSSGWYYTCTDGVEVDLEGIGMDGQTTGTVVIPNSASVDSMIVVAVSKGGSPPASVDFSTNNGQSATANAVITTNAPNGNSCSSCRVYESKFNGAGSVSINTGGNQNIQSVHVFVFRTGASGSSSSSAIPVNEYYYKGENNFSVPIETATANRTLTISVPISELANDSRKATIIADAGGVNNSVTHTTYDTGLGNSLRFATVTLNNVPGSASSVAVQIKSPNSGGDSFVVGGYVTVKSDCNQTTDYGDAPAVYGSASADIDAGVSLGSSVDAEAGNQPSMDADGDDVNGSDDEDGITFLGATGGCNGDPGSSQKVKVTVLQSVWNDMFINGWVDFDGNEQFDSDEKIVSNEPVYNSANPQQFTFTYTIPADAVPGATFARFRLTNGQTSSATGFIDNGGEVEDYPYTVCGGTSDSNDWSFDCDDGIRVDIIGDGIHGEHSATLDIPDDSNVDSIKVVAVFKNGTAPSTVTFSTSSESVVAPAETIAAAPNGNSCSSCRVYEATLDGASSVDLDFSGTASIHSFVAYVFRDVGTDAGSAYGVEVNEYFYKGEDTFTIPIDTESQARDITVTVPVSELNDDSRIVEVKVTAGSDVETVTYTDYDPDLGPSLRIISVLMEDVPGSVDEIMVRIKSPNSGGDSFVVGGYVNIESNCGSNSDYGDAPSSYGDASEEILDGVSLGSDVDADASSQNSTDADGDDEDGNDDEDGVTFVGSSGGCDIEVGQTHEVSIDVTQTVLNNTYINAWIDFNGDGDFDSDERIVDNELVEDDPALQNFVFEYDVPGDAATGMTYARFRLSDEETDSPTGALTGGGEVEDYVIEICNPVDPPQTWVFNCDDEVTVETIGIGIEGQTSGTLNITDLATVDSVILVAVNMFDTPPNFVTFESSTGQIVEAPEMDMSTASGGSSCGNCTYYIARLNPAASYDIDTEGATAVQTFVAYVFRTGAQTDCSAAGLMVGTYFKKGSETYTLPLNSDAGVRDITVDIPLSDMDNNSNEVEITVSSGGITTTESYTSSDPLLGNSLNIASITLSAVPGTATSVDVTISSPDSGGETAGVGGYISLKANCVVGDRGDAPITYGDPTHTIVPGLRIGNEIDSETGPKYSSNADGDDQTGIDDEDGVEFTAQSSSCFGTVGSNEELYVKVLNSQFFDVYLNGWIDFNGDGDFDTNEKVIDNFQIFNSASAQNFVFNYFVPNNAFVGQTYARFRVASDPSESAIDNESEGEVEDYVCFIAAAVPVELTRFFAQEIEEGVQLLWDTETERNNSGFEIQRSKDGIDWEILDFVEGAGTTFAPQNYEWVDESPYEGDNYYRLRQVDFDGQFEYSNIQIVQIADLDNREVQFFPNPFIDQLTLKVPQAFHVADEYELTVYNTAGIVERVFTGGVNGEIAVNIEDLSEGSYIVELKIGETVHRKLLVKID